MIALYSISLLAYLITSLTDILFGALFDVEISGVLNILKIENFLSLISEEKSGKTGHCVTECLREVFNRSKTERHGINLMMKMYLVFG